MGAFLVLALTAIETLQKDGRCRTIKLLYAALETFGTIHPAIDPLSPVFLLI